MKRFGIITLLFLAMFAFSCKKDNNPPTDPNGGPGGNVGDDIEVPVIVDTVAPYTGELATDAAMDVIDYGNDSIYWEANNWSNEMTITYSDAGTVVSKSNSDIICYQDGSHVVVDLLTNTVKGVKIIIQGKASDGSLKVYGEKKWLLVMNGVDLTSSKGPAVNNQCGKRLFVHLNEGTTNRLTDPTSYSDDIWYHPSSVAADEDRKAALFSEGSIIMSGTGAVVIAGKAKSGIATDDYYYQRPGSSVVITEAANHCIKSNGSEGLGIVFAGGYIYANVAATAGKCLKTDLDISILGGKMVLNTTGGSEYDSEEKDTSSPACLKADGNIVISDGDITCVSTGKGGKGISVDGSLTVDGGKISIATSGGRYEYSRNLTSSPKGIKADGDIIINGGAIAVSVTGVSEGSEGVESKANITINGGSTYVLAYDDAVNAAKSITVNDGRICAISTDNDGIDSNGKLYIKGGLSIACGTNQPEEAFDADQASNFIISGGVLIGTAGGIMTTPSNSSSQRSLVYQGLSMTKDALMAILDASGNVVMVYTFPRTFNSGVLTVSTPDFTQGSTFSIYTGGSVSGAGDGIWGYYDDGTYSGGTKKSDFTTSQTVTTIGNGGGGPGGGGGGPGGGGGHH